MKPVPAAFSPRLLAIRIVSSLNVRRIVYLAFFALLGVNGAIIAESAAGSAHDEQAKEGRYSEQSPFIIDDFLARIVSLMSGHAGNVTKKQFEDLFGVPLVNVRRDKDGSVAYWIDADRDWFFDVAIWETAPSFVAPGDPDLSDAIRRFSISWKPEKFSELKPGECITAARVRAAFTGTKWTIPGAWGLDPAPQRETSRLGHPSECQGTNVGCPTIEDFGVNNQVYFRMAPVSTLPEIRVESLGSSANSCVTGFSAAARP